MRCDVMWSTMQRDGDVIYMYMRCDAMSAGWRKSADGGRVEKVGTGRRSVDVKVKKLNQAQVNGGSRYDSLNSRQKSAQVGRIENVGASRQDRESRRTAERGRKSEVGTSRQKSAGWRKSAQDGGRDIIEVGGRPSMEHGRQSRKSQSASVAHGRRKSESHGAAAYNGRRKSER